MRSASSGAPFYHYYHHVSLTHCSSALQRRAAVCQVWTRHSHHPFVLKILNTHTRKGGRKREGHFQESGANQLMLYGVCGAFGRREEKENSVAPNSAPRRNWIKLSGIDLTRERANYKESNCGTCLIKLGGQRSIHSGAGPKSLQRRQTTIEKKSAGWIAKEKRHSMCCWIIIYAARPQWDDIGALCANFGPSGEQFYFK